MPQMFVLDGSNELTEMTESSYETEDVLQQLLADFPKLLPADLSNGTESRRWLLLEREAGIAFEGLGGDRWSIDHLFVDQDAIPTLVEVKRATDTRARREVVAQMLDYASSICLMGAEGIRAAFEENGNSDEVLTELLNTGPEPDIDAFWEEFATNLSAGRIRLIFLADSLSTELRRIIVFLAQQFREAEVFGVEIRQFIGQNRLKTLVPTLFANTSVNTAKAAAKRTILSRAQFEESLRENASPAVADGALRLMRWCEQNGGFLTFGNPSCFLNWRIDERKAIWPFAIYTTGTIEVTFQSMKYRAPFDDVEVRRELQRRFNEIDGIKLADDRIDKRPSFPISILSEQTKVDGIVDVLTWFVAQIRQ